MSTVERISIPFVRREFTAGATLRSMAVLIFAGAISFCACQQNGPRVDERAGFRVVDSADCLPADITLVDQNGRQVALSSLKGKPTLFDFIYTSCPGECLVLTQRMRVVATRLGPALGTTARIVSITVDPEHDGPAQLHSYANQQGANLNGWLFLTGTPKQIDAAMARFNLIRQHEADGSVDHVLEMFLVAPNGHALLQYRGDKISPARAVADIDAAAAGKAVTAGDGTIVPVAY
jgi:cytochrome oxidase Cu insertion factor (SCO1/SenC/PrrC family)